MDGVAIHLTGDIMLTMVVGVRGLTGGLITTIFIIIGVDTIITILQVVDIFAMVKCLLSPTFVAEIL
jgi:hypothetical protein